MPGLCGERRAVRATQEQESEIMRVIVNLGVSLRVRMRM